MGQSSGWLICRRAHASCQPAVCMQKATWHELSSQYYDMHAQAWATCAQPSTLYATQVRHRGKLIWWQARSGRTSRNSITPSRALRTRGVSVFTTMFGAAGIAHDATGFGAFATYTQEHTALKAYAAMVCAHYFACRSVAQPFSSLPFSQVNKVLSPEHTACCATAQDTRDRARQVGLAQSHLHQAHAAVSGDREALVVAKPAQAIAFSLAVRRVKSKPNTQKLEHQQHGTCLGMSMPAASQAAITVAPLSTSTCLSFTVTIMWLGLLGFNGSFAAASWPVA